MTALLPRAPMPLTIATLLGLAVGAPAIAVSEAADNPNPGD